MFKHHTFESYASNAIPYSMQCCGVQVSARSTIGIELRQASVYN